MCQGIESNWHPRFNDATKEIHRTSAFRMNHFLTSIYTKISNYFIPECNKCQIVYSATQLKQAPQLPIHFIISMRPHKNYIFNLLVRQCFALVLSYAAAHCLS